MFETAEFIKNSGPKFTGSDRHIYCIGVFSGYLMCHFNYLDGISLQTYQAALAMIEDGASVVEVVEYLEASVGRNGK